MKRTRRILLSLSIFVLSFITYINTVSADTTFVRRLALPGYCLSFKTSGSTSCRWFDTTSMYDDQSVDWTKPTGYCATQSKQDHSAEYSYDDISTASFTNPQNVSKGKKIVRYLMYYGPFGPGWSNEGNNNANNLYNQVTNSNGICHYIKTTRQGRSTYSEPETVVTNGCDVTPELFNQYLLNHLFISDAFYQYLGSSDEDWTTAGVTYDNNGTSSIARSKLTALYDYIDGTAGTTAYNNIPSTFKVYYVKNPDSARQDFVFWRNVPVTTTYCAELIKNSVSGLTFNSAKFKVYSTDDCSGTATEEITLSSSTSSKKWEGLTSNASFSVKESQAPSGFAANNSCIKLTPSTTCVPSVVTNYPIYITFAKQNEKNEKMAGAKFKVKNASGAYITTTSTRNSSVNNCYVYTGTSSTDGTELETDSDGLICIAKIPDGTYSAIETASGNSAYVVDDSNKTITGITTSTSVQTFAQAKKLTNYPLLVNFYKVDEKGNAKSGAKFKLKNASGQYITVSGTSSDTNYNGCYIYSGIGTDGSELTTASQDYTNGIHKGEICVVKIPDGTYSAEETSTGDASYYLNPSAKTITGITTSRNLVGFSSAKKLVNYPLLINFYKVEEKGGPKPGAKFKVKNSSGQYITVNGISSDTNYVGCYIYSGANGTGTELTTSSQNNTGGIRQGEICIVKVPNDTYIAEETSTGDASYYLNPSAKTITGITPSTSLKNYDSAISLTNYPFVINFYKINEKNEKMAGAKFRVKNASGAYVKVKSARATTENYNGCYEYNGVDSTGSELTTSDTNYTNGVSIGEICIYKLPEGTYTAVETSTGNSAYYVDPDDNELTGIATKTSITTYENAKKKKNYPYLINFYKVDELGGILEGVTFKVKNSSNSYIKVKNERMTENKYNGCYIYDGTDTDGSDLVTSDRDYQNGVHKGEICIAKVPNGSYSAVETNTGSDTYYVDPNNNTISGIQAVTELDEFGRAKSLTNYPYVIQMAKVKEDGNTYTSGASFKIYYTENDTKYYLKSSGTSQINKYKGCYIYSAVTTNTSEAGLFETSRSTISGGVSTSEICVMKIENKSGRKYYAEEHLTNDVRYHVTNNTIEMSGPNTSRKDIDELPEYINEPFVLNFYKVNENGDTSVTFESEFIGKASNNKYIKVLSNKSNVAKYKGCYIFDSFVNSESEASTLVTLTSDQAPLHKNEICIIQIPQKENFSDTNVLTYSFIEKSTGNDAYFIPSNNSINNLNVTEDLLTFEDTRTGKKDNRPYLINWYKYNENKSTKLDGAKFNITDSNGNNIGWDGTESYTDEAGNTRTCYIYSASGNTEFTSGVTGNPGEVCVVRVPKYHNNREVTYTITEIDPAKHHTFGSIDNITLNTSEKFSSNTDSNTFINYETEFEFTKRVGTTKSGVSVEGSETILVNGEEVTLDSLTLSELKNIIFNIYDSNDNLLSFVKTGDGEYEFVQNPNMDGISGTPVQNLTVGSSKKIKVKHLAEGTYYIKENNSGTCESSVDYTKCIGYYDQETTQSFEITDCSSENATATICRGSSGKVTATMTNTPTEITFTKSDFYSYIDEADTVKFENAEEVRAFDDIVFKLFTYDERGNKEYITLKHVGNSGVCTSENSYSIYRYVDGDTSDGSAGTELHTCGGHLVITNLCRGKKYYIEEVSVPGYSVFTLPEREEDRIREYTVPCKEGEITPEHDSTTNIINDKPTRVVFQKKDSKYGYLIPDETTTFELYRCKKNTECHPSDGNDSNAVKVKFSARGKITGDEEDTNKEVYKFLTTSDEEGGASGETELHPYLGELIIRYLPGGYEYVLLETKAPLNYTLPRGRNRETRFTVDTSTINVEEIDVPNKPTSLLLRKYAQDGELLEGAVFKIYEGRYEGTKCNPNLTAAKQPKEELRLKTIRDGIYENREVKDTDKIVTCIDKDDYKCNEMTSTLTYHDYIGEWVDFENSVNQYDESIELQEGEALIQYLEYGHCYIIEEVEAPKGYSLPEKEEDRFIMVEIEAEDDIVDTYKELVNKPTPYTFYKFDEKNQLIDGGEFKLQKLNSDKIYEDVTVSEYIPSNIEEIDRKYYKVDKESTNTKIETQNGTATIYYLEEGQYRIVETKAPENMELPKKQINVATFYVDKNGKVTGSSIITNKPKTEKIEIMPKASAELIVSISTGQQVIKYGLIISLITLSIFGLIYIQTKSKKDK